MNFDNLKDAWASDQAEGISLPATIVPTGKISSAVARIRKNMQREFILQIGAFIVLIIFVWSRADGSSFFLRGIALFILLMQTMYYYFRFYVFYRRIGRLDLSIRKSISAIAYELELTIESYKTFNFCATPLIALIIFGVGTLWVVCLKLALFQIVIFFLLKLHIHLRYGRYLAELKKIMEDLEAEIE